MRATDQSTLTRLWDELRVAGVEGDPRLTLQLLPYGCDKRAYLIEALFTGLYTTFPDILIRCWVQAHGYCEALAARGEEPGAWLRDQLSLLRCRAEGHFLRGEV